MDKDTSAPRPRQEPTRPSAPSTPSPNLTAALAYGAKGIPVKPLHEVVNGQCSCLQGARCGNPGKHPWTPKGTEPSTDAEQIRQWWTTWPQAGIGIYCGVVFDALDVDVHEGAPDGHVALAELEQERGMLPDTVLSLTGGGGEHHLFRHQAGVTMTLPTRRGLEWHKAGYIIAPPTMHSSGRTYQWREGRGLDDIALADVPRSWQPQEAPRQAPGKPVSTSFTNGTTRYGAKALREECAVVAAARPGVRNATLNRCATKIGSRVAGGEIDEAEARAALEQAALSQSEPLLLLEIRRTLESGFTSGLKDPRSAPPRTRTTTAEATTAPVETPAPRHYAQTDMGHAERLVARHGANLRYNYEAERWYVWDGCRWTPDATGEVDRRAKDTVRAMQREAAEEPEDTLRAALLKHAATCQARAKLDAMVALARSEPGIAVREQDFDADPWLLCVHNGIVDLRTGQLSPHRRDELMTKLVPVTYDPAAKCPRFERFLFEVFANQKELVFFLQRAVGASLCGEVRDHVLLVLYGGGSNGKSTLMETLLALFGDYGHRAAPSTFLAQHREGPRPDIADLKGCRFLSALETAEGDRLDEATVKALCGGDAIRARHLYARAFTFQPQFTPWLATNHRPIVRGQDYALWRRLKLVPFDVLFEGDRQDPTLKAQLRDELPGLLTWAIEGCQWWQSDGLGQPKEVTAATDAYKSEMDVTGDYLSECCELGLTFTEAAGDIYKSYVAWCEGNRYRPASQTAFGSALTERGYRRERAGSGRYLRHGLRLRSQPV